MLAHLASADLRVKLVLDTILLVEARPRLRSLGSHVLDRVVAAAFERDQNGRRGSRREDEVMLDV
jgi:hypothetical protein